jgi:membrane dipeptidase
MDPKRNLDNRVVGRQLSASQAQRVSMRVVYRLLGLALLVSAGLAVRLPAQDYRAQALRILKTVPLIDGHNDIPDAIRVRGGLDSVDFAVLQPKLMSDIPKLRAGGVGAQFWAAYVPVTTMDSGPHPAVYALEQIDLIKRLCAKYPRDLAMAYRAADVERNFTAGKISCLIGIEGGHAIENSLGALRMFAALGVRYITLTHWRSLSWATASTDTARRGLSPFGRDVVHEMNRLGIVVDLSHVNDATMSDALHTTRAPLMFSHSSARALTGHARDVPDSILKLVPGNGGIVMVNFNPGFVSEAVRVYEDSMEAHARALRAAGRDAAVVADSLRVWAARAPKATLAQVADHIDHIRAVAGVDHVGIGSDFDGITEVPVGLEDVSKFPDLIAELLRRGWSEQDVRKVAGLNVLRVLRATEQVAAKR